MLVLLAPQVPWGTVDSPGGYCVQTVCIIAEDPKLRESQSFIMGYNLPRPSLRWETFITLESKTNLPLLSRMAHFCLIFPGWLLCKHCQKIIWSKTAAVSASVLKTCGNMTDLWRIVSWEQSNKKYINCISKQVGFGMHTIMFYIFLPKFYITLCVDEWT